VILFNCSSAIIELLFCIYVASALVVYCTVFTCTVFSIKRMFTTNSQFYRQNQVVAVPLAQLFDIK